MRNKTANQLQIQLHSSVLALVCLFLIAVTFPCFANFEEMSQSTVKINKPPKSLIWGLTDGVSRTEMKYQLHRDNVIEQINKNMSALYIPLKYTMSQL